MNQTITTPGRGLGASALVLRLGLAAVLCGIGYQWLRTREILAAQPAPAPLVDFEGPTRLPAPEFPEAAGAAQPAEVRLDGSTVEVRFPRHALGGAAFLLAGGLLAVGLATRWLALGGLVLLTGETLAEGGLINLGSRAAMAPDLTHDTVTSVLVQVILLALLVSGSGAVGIDRLWANRRAARRRPAGGLLAS